MGQTIAYLRRHQWQRRVLTTLTTVTVCALVAVLSYPHVRNYMILRKLGSDRPAVQQSGIVEARNLMKADPSAVHYFDGSLASADDRTFLGLVQAMTDAEVFDLGMRPADQIDRYHMLRLEQAGLPIARRAAAQELLRSRRENEYVHRAAASATRDADPGVREMGSALAAVAGDDQPVRTLLADSDPFVVASAATDAGLARRTELAKDIAVVLDARVKQASTRPAPKTQQTAAELTIAASGPVPASATSSLPVADPVETARLADREVISNCAFALAKIAPREYSHRLASLLSQASDPALRARLLYVMPLLGDAAARQAVQTALTVPDGKYPPAAAIVAGARLGLPQAGQIARRVLADLAKKPLPADVVRAACHAAEIMDLPVRDEVYDLSVQIWDSRDVPTLMSLAGLLGREAQRRSLGGAAVSSASRPATAATSHTATSQAASRPTSITRGDCVRRLFQLAGISEELGGETVDIASAMPSAAAAVACVRLVGNDAWSEAKRAASASPLAAYYIAFQAVGDPKIDAMGMGLSMLSDPKDPQDDWTYSNNVRLAGAVLLALAPQTRTEVLQARQRLTTRYGTVNDPYLKKTYEAALAALGQKEFLASAKASNMQEAAWVDAQEIPGNAPIPTHLPVFATLLLAAGDTSPLDWLLMNDRVDLRTAAYVLLGLQMLGPVNHILPEQQLDWSATDDLLWWQVNLTRHAYALHRGPMTVDRSSANKS